MLNKQIFFTDIHKAELQENEIVSSLETAFVIIASKRIQVEPIVSRIEKPENAPEIYNELCDDPNFPMGTVFDWRKV